MAFLLMAVYLNQLWLLIKETYDGLLRGGEFTFVNVESKYSARSFVDVAATYKN